MLSMSLMFKQINENHPNAPYYLGLCEYRGIEPDCVVAIFGRPCFSLRPSPTRPGRRHLKLGLNPQRLGLRQSPARPGGRHWKFNFISPEVISHPTIVAPKSSYLIRQSLLRCLITSADPFSGAISHEPSSVASHIASPRLSSRASFLYSSNSPTKRTLLVLLITFTSTSTYDYSLCLFNADMPYL